MERKWRFNLFVKEAAKRWYVCVALLVVCIAGGIALSAIRGTSNYTAAASISVQISNPSVSDANIISREGYNLYTKVVDADLRSALTAKVVELSDGRYTADSDMSDVYEISADVSYVVYKMEVSMDAPEKSLAVAKVFSDYVMGLNLNEFVPSNFDAKQRLDRQAYISDSSISLPIWMTSILGAVAGLVIYAGVCACIFYFNRNLYDAEEFKDNFAVQLLGDSSNMTNIAIKTLLNREKEGLFVVAVNAECQTDSLVGGFMAIGSRVVVSDMSAVIAGADAKLEKGVFSVLKTDESRPFDGLSAGIEALRKKLSNDYDVLIVSAEYSSDRKDLLLAASAVDATVVALDLKRDNYKKLREMFEELGEVKNIKLAGAII